MASTTPSNDPFQDPSQMAAPDTLAVGREVSLTIADSLIVLDNDVEARKEPGCCGVGVSSSSGSSSNNNNNNKTTRSIPFYNVLWAEYSSDGSISIQHAQPTSKGGVRPAALSYQLDKHDSGQAAAWVERLLERAYGPAQRRKRIKVVVNPFGGPGGALKTYQKRIAPILAAARCELDVQQTQWQGHGIEIAQQLDTAAFDVVACCSGDGIPHEVWNGLGRRPDAARALAQVAVTQLPCGSGNGLSLSFHGTANPSLAALAVVKGLRTPLDLASVTQGGRRTLSFLSQAVGILAEADLATEHLRWMGSARFTWGVLVRIFSKHVYPADVAVKVELGSKPAVREAFRAHQAKGPPADDQRALPPPDAGLPALKYGSAQDPLPPGWELIPSDHLGNFYAGNVATMSPDATFFPAAIPDDGCLDLVRIHGNLPRASAVKTMLAVASNTFFDMPDVDYQKVTAYRITPKNQANGYISIDGERIPFEGFQVEVHQGLGTTLSKTGYRCEVKGV